MSYDRLFVLVEGDDDERYFKNVLVPRLEKVYDHVQTWQYARRKNEKIGNFLRAIRQMGADYLYIADLDDVSCVTARKNAVTDSQPEVSDGRVVVVVREIEGWYYASVGPALAENLDVRQMDETEGVTKEQFQEMIPGDYDSRINFQAELLNHYSLDEAVSRNQSLCYFVERFIPDA